MKIIEKCMKCEIDILYISPEVLESDLVLYMRDFPKINFVCIDEAHCISEWSHNFRTSYLIIEKLISRYFKCDTILAMTATATY